jgi:hypothetical protein
MSKRERELINRIASDLKDYTFLEKLSTEVEKELKKMPDKKSDISGLCNPSSAQEKYTLSTNTLR